VASELALATEPQLDPATRTLRLDGRQITLTQLEYDLLRHLHQRSGETISRAELLHEVWGHQWQGGGNVIEVAVSGVRRKLGNRASLIETVRGKGYRWHDP
jgi:DNA-binding response OmpR family regulator